MAPRISLLVTTTLSLAALSSADTIQFDIARNPAVRDAQLAKRQLEIQAQGGLWSRGELEQRANTVGVSLTNAEQQGLYFANVSVGTPGQSLALQIDTGSSDIWLPSSTATLCRSVRAGGCPNGQFTASSSTTFVDVEKGGFNISYVDGTGSAGDYFQDTFRLGGATITNFQMGLALTTTIGTGIMGIGYNSSEANVATGNGTVYANLPYAMVDQGIINTEAYSLWLNDLDSSTGSVLFGGVDTGKYIGDLVSIDVYPSSRSGRITSFTVAWTSLSATSSSGTDVLTPANFAQPAILDSGTTITLLPDDVAAVVFQELGATVSQQLGAVVVPCALARNNGTLNYGFGGSGGPIVKVPMNELVLPLVLTNGRVPTYQNGQTACQLGIQAAGSLPILLGDTFLRSAYAVYDLVNNKIALANTDFNSTSSNIVPFASSGAPIPSATEAANNAAVTQTISGIPKVQTTATADGVSVSPTYNPTATGLSAASGFAATSTSTSTSISTSSKKSAAGHGPEPFSWSRVVIGGVTVALMGVGSGFFAFL